MMVTARKGDGKDGCVHLLLVEPCGHASKCVRTKSVSQLTRLDECERQKLCVNLERTNE